MSEHPVFVAMVRAHCEAERRCEGDAGDPVLSCNYPLSENCIAYCCTAYGMRAALAAAAALGAKMVEREPTKEQIAAATDQLKIKYAFYAMPRIGMYEEAVFILRQAWDAAPNIVDKT